MSFLDSSSDEDSYVNSARALKALRKKLVVTASPVEQDSPNPEDTMSPYIVGDDLISDEPPVPPPRPKTATRRGARSSRRIAANSNTDNIEILPQIPAKETAANSISLIDSDPDEVTVTTVNDFENTSGVDADENYEMTIKINWQSARLERVPLRRYQEFSQVFEYFSAMANVPQERIWLVLRNKITIQPADTPDSLGITIVDIIEGGIIDGSTESTSGSANVDKDSIIIKIQTKDQKKTLSISIKKNQKIKILTLKCAEQLKIPEDKIKFQFDGEPVHPNDTPESLDLEGGECFDMHTIS